MPRQSRSNIRTNYFHVMIQGINKSYIFEQAEDINNYIATMYNLIQAHEIEIIAYCIMSNHAHLLLKTEKIQELSKYMHRLNTKYALYYNKKYDRVGYLFRDRYKTQGIYSQEQMHNCIKYIYNNPVKAGICKAAREYTYSNYKEIEQLMKDNYSFKCVEQQKGDDYYFIDIEEEEKSNCREILKRFLFVNNIKLTQLQSNEEKLREIIKILKEKNNVSLRRIAEELNINREKVRKIYKDKQRVSKSPVPFDTF